MDSLLTDIRFWLGIIGFIFSALITKIIKSYDKQFDILFEKQRSLEDEVKVVHQMISGHYEYHRGIEKGENKNA